MDLDQPWLSRPHLQTFPEVINEKGRLSKTVGVLLTEL